MPVPYTFGTATASIPLSQLDSNFATAITIGNTAVQLGNTVTTLNNMTLANVTISSGNVTITNVSVTTANVSGTANVQTLAVTQNATIAGNATVTGNVSMNVGTITTANVSGTANVSSLVVLTNETVLGNTTVTGNVTAALFSGSGASLSSLNASNVTSGTIATARLASGTASSSTYLRGDQTWATITGTSPGGSTTQVQYNSSGSFAGSANLTFDGTTLTAVNNINVPNTFGFKNRIINGAMVIDQRNAGASVTPTNGQYLVDRFTTALTQASKFTAQQSTTAPTGFTNSLKITSSSAYSVVSTDYFGIGQVIEGFNVADLGWGTANAKTVTLSFQVYSSLTGTFGGAIFNDAANRSYPFTYSISSANTWTTVSVTIAGDITGTWATNNTGGMKIYFSLGTGSTYSGTAGAWAGTFYLSATGATSVVGTNGATFYITGVQLEKGSTATSFDYRPYGTELALCQRYYQNSYDIGTAPATATTIGMRALGYAISALTTGYGAVFFQIPMRSAPTIAIYDGAGTVSNVSTVSSGSTTFTNGRAQAAVPFNISTNTFVHQGQAIVASVLNFIHFTASAEL